MTDYKEMYLKLFDGIENAIELLKAAQQQGEDIYVETSVNTEKRKLIRKTEE